MDTALRLRVVVQHRLAERFLADELYRVAYQLGNRIVVAKFAGAVGNAAVEGDVITDMAVNVTSSVPGNSCLASLPTAEPVSKRAWVIGSTSGAYSGW